MSICATNAFSQAGNYFKDGLGCFRNNRVKFFLQRPLCFDTNFILMTHKVMLLMGHEKV